jgi:hypothetical protein
MNPHNGWLYVGMEKTVDIDREPMNIGFFDAEKRMIATLHAQIIGQCLLAQLYVSGQVVDHVCVAREQVVGRVGRMEILTGDPIRLHTATLTDGTIEVTLMFEEGDLDTTPWVMRAAEVVIASRTLEAV